jgi:hypothetical protein
MRYAAACNGLSRFSCGGTVTKRTEYDDDTKAQAVARGRELGAAAAGRELGIDAALIRVWMYRRKAAQKATQGDDDAIAAEVRRLESTPAEAKSIDVWERLRDKFQKRAEREANKAGSGTGLRNATTAAAIAEDKIAKLRAEATPVSDPAGPYGHPAVSAIHERAEKLYDEIVARRERGEARPDTKGARIVELEVENAALRVELAAARMAAPQKALPVATPVPADVLDQIRESDDAIDAESTG